MLGDVSAVSAFLLAVFLFLSAFFSGSEAALLSVQRVRIRHLANLRVAGARRVAQMVERPERLLPPILLGNNLVNTGAAAVATTVAIGLIADESLAVATATGAVTIALLVFGETIPKTLAARYAERTAILVAPAIQVISWVLRPISFVLLALGSAIVKVFGGGSVAEEVTEEEVKTLARVASQGGAMEPEEAEMIRRLLEFGDRRVSELMTPRPEIVTLGANADIQEFLSLYSENYHTRFPVVRDTIDDVVGFVAVKDVMRQLASGARLDSPVTLELHEVRFVPETRLLSDLFDDMRRKREQLVMVADEYGGVAGLVTLKRLVEGIVGRVPDDEVREGSEDAWVLDEDAVELDGSLAVSEANERLGLGIPPGEYETVAGFLLEHRREIPAKGDFVEHGNLRFTVRVMQGRRIMRVRVDRMHREQ